MDCKNGVISKYWYICIFPEKNLDCWRYSHRYAEKGNHLLVTSKYFLRAHSHYWYFLQVLDTKLIFALEFSQVTSHLVLDKHQQLTSEHLSSDALNTYKHIRFYFSSILSGLETYAAHWENSAKDTSLTLGAKQSISRNHTISKQYLKLTTVSVTLHLTWGEWSAGKLNSSVLSLLQATEVTPGT